MGLLDAREMVAEDNDLPALFGKHHGCCQGRAVIGQLLAAGKAAPGRLSHSHRASVLLPRRRIGQSVFKAGALMICRKTIISDRTANLSHRAISFILHFIPLYCNTLTLTLLTLLSLTQTLLLCRLPQKLGKWKHNII